MNRSMEAHHLLSKRGFRVRSFGSGTNVKLPGLAQDRPNVYDFSTPYEVILRDLTRLDEPFYTQNGILNMLDRNRRIKIRPERFQDYFTEILAKRSRPSAQDNNVDVIAQENKDIDKFDIIFTCEERVYDQVVEDLEKRNWDWSGSANNSKKGELKGKDVQLEENYTNSYEPVHVVNIDITDNQEEATLGAFLFCEICELMRESEDLDNDIDEILTEVEHSSDRTILHTLCFY
ncbi:unnamed protein product [Gordionus sp. m RMFG-2023]